MVGRWHPLQSGGADGKEEENVSIPRGYHLALQTRGEEEVVASSGVATRPCKRRGGGLPSDGVAIQHYTQTRGEGRGEEGLPSGRGEHPALQTVKVRREMVVTIQQETTGAETIGRCEGCRGERGGGGVTIRRGY